jgi:hypothetical protein
MRMPTRAEVEEAERVIRAYWREKGEREGKQLDAMDHECEALEALDNALARLALR